MPRELIQTIFSRRSIRKYTKEPISETDIKTLLEAAMARFADVLARDLGAEVRGLPGAGAAGGLGAGLVAFAGARLEPGAALVLDVLRFDDHLEGATAVLTGEGAVNPQTLRGKAPWEVHRRARAQGIPTLILAGDISIVIMVRDGDGDGVLDDAEKYDDQQYVATLNVNPTLATGAFIDMCGDGALSTGVFNFVDPPGVDTAEFPGFVDIEDCPPQPVEQSTWSNLKALYR